MRTDASSKNLKVMAHIPELVDSFEAKVSGKFVQINVLKKLDDYYTLAQVREKYPKSISEQEELTRKLFLATPIYSSASADSVADVLEYSLNTPVCLSSFGKNRKDKCLYL